MVAREVLEYFGEKMLGHLYLAGNFSTQGGAVCFKSEVDEGANGVFTRLGKEHIYFFC